MDSCSTALTVAGMEVKRSVVLPTREWLTDSASLFATSAATFLAIRAVRKLVRMGCSSSSVRTAPPVMFFTPRVSVLKRLEARLCLPDSCLVSACPASSSSEPEERDLSSSAMNSASSPEPRNSFCLARKSASLPSSAAFLEKSRFFMVVLVTLPYSHWRASFFGFSAAVSSLASFAPFLPGAPALAFASGPLLGPGPAPPPSAASPSPSSSSSSFPDRFSFSSLPLLLFFFVTAGSPFSDLFF
mmetsp:Transcript_30806/g.98181  ORF Transcript_30806/g.98181 Transcript_30806/m.98181 type:complete len:244 (-) Transcript_30806:548-1279(-)